VPSWQVAGVAVGLAASADHRVVVLARATDGCALLGLLLGSVGGKKQGLFLGDSFLVVAPLLGFEYEAVALVEVDAAGGGGAIAELEGDVELEDVIVLL
jgi:hypothetical protein